MGRSLPYASWFMLVPMGVVSVISLFTPALIPDSTGQTTLYQENAFLRIGNINGTATTKGYEGQIVVKEMSYQISQQGKWGQTTRITVFGDVKISKDMDRSSPLLATACATKEAFPVAVVSLTTGGSLYLKVTLEGVIVSSVSVGFVSGTGRPGEVVTLSYQKATWEWGTIKGGYDLKQNIKM